MCGRFCDTSGLCVHLTSGSFSHLKRNISESFEHAWAIMPIKTSKQNISLIGLLAELMSFSQVFAAPELLLYCIQAYMTICHGFCLYTTVNLTKKHEAVHFLFFNPPSIFLLTKITKCIKFTILRSVIHARATFLKCNMILDPRSRPAQLISARVTFLK